MLRLFLPLILVLMTVPSVHAGVCSSISGILDRLLGERSLPASAAPINAEEKVRAYIGSSAINKAMRSGRPLTLSEAQEVRDLTRALETYPVYAGESVRFVKYDVADLFKTGEEFSDPAFFSASKGAGADVQGDFIYTEAVLHVRGQSARDISSINPLEKEVVFLPGTKFRVVEKKGSFVFDDKCVDMIEADAEELQEFGELSGESFVESQKKQFRAIRDHFKDFDIEAFKRGISRTDLDEASIRRIRTIDDLLKAGFNPIIDITLEEVK